MASLHKKWALLLAAGASERMGHPKALLADDKGRTFLRRLKTTFAGAGLKVAVVVGAHSAEIRAAYPKLTFIENPDWVEGQWSSVHQGLFYLLTLGAEEVWLHPIDAPLLKPATLRTLRAALKGKGAVYPSFEDEPGHPVGLTREVAKQVLRGPWHRFDDALKALKAVPVPVKDSAVTENINAPADYLVQFGRLPKVGK
jgi:CTP:molybdopterin cytidylyltransferase MocA